VHDSLSFMTPDDLDAMASYLLDVTNGSSAPALVAAKRLPPEIAARAAKLYADNCATCHQAFRHALCGLARCSCPRRYPGNAEFCGVAERQRCCRSCQLRAHELG